MDFLICSVFLHENFPPCEVYRIFPAVSLMPRANSQTTFKRRRSLRREILPPPENTNLVEEMRNHNSPFESLPTSSDPLNRIEENNNNRLEFPGSQETKNDVKRDTPTTESSIQRSFRASSWNSSSSDCVPQSKYPSCEINLGRVTCDEYNQQIAFAISNNYTGNEIDHFVRSPIDSDSSREIPLYRRSLRKRKKPGKFEPPDFRSFCIPKRVTRVNRVNRGQEGTSNTISDTERHSSVACPASDRLPRPTSQSSRTHDHLLVTDAIELDNDAFYDVGLLNVKCDYCGALSFECEKDLSRNIFLKCCNGGKIQLDNPRPIPTLFQELLRFEHTNSKHFMSNIRSYNNALSFASVQYSDTTFDGCKIPSVIVNGEMRHLIGPLLPQGTKPVYSQLYVIDPLDNEPPSEVGGNCDQDLLNELRLIIRVSNPFARSYQMMFERYNELRASPAVSIPTIRMWFVTGSGDNHRDFYGKIRLGRRSIKPVYNEVAVICTGDGDAPSLLNTNLCVYTRGPPGKSSFLQKISPMSGLCDPLCYSVMFPLGQTGYKPKILSVTERRFYLYRLMVRENDYILSFGRLSQQYIIDCFLRIECSRLNFITLHQDKIRADTYAGLHDQLRHKSEEHNAKMGRCKILPSTFEGSSRHMYESYQDSMVLVRNFGKPDLFITFTCNPQWPDILRNLQPGQAPIDRPDIVSRVFHLKLKKFLDLIKSGYLGKILAYNYVIEFQKRGLPHVHILVYLASPIKTIEDVDTLISAQIPDKETDPRLYDVIVSQNIHTCLPSRCYNEKGKCMKNFPKPLGSETTLSTNGFPLYARPRIGPIKLRNKLEIDNSLVVPYNRKLSLCFNAHINVEACVSIQSVKYINMYMQKGGDIATVAVSKTSGENEIIYDEVEEYKKGRYIGACEAMWRIFGYKLSGMSHTVIRLAVHLPGQNTVLFKPGEERSALTNANDTTLTGWFQLNSVDPDARAFLYTEIPNYYVWDKTKRPYRWRKRVQCKNNRVPTLTRMYHVFPSDMERFSLRLLLLHMRGVTSFESILAGCKNFRERALQCGLLANDFEWINCMEEACATLGAFAIRSLFVYICFHCSPSNPKDLWDRYKTFMFSSVDDTEKRILLDLERRSRSINSKNSIAQLGIDFDDDHEDSRIEEEVVDIDDLNFRKSQLNDDQMFALTSVINSLDNVNYPKLFFLYGSGGTGKTYVYNTMIMDALSRGKHVLPMAFTGIASSLLLNGSTIHSVFSIPINGEDSSILSVSPSSLEGKRLAQTSLFIFDEATMIPLWMFNYIDKLLRDVTGCTNPFGGKTVVFGGDFRQCLPVLDTNDKFVIVSSCISSSPLWDQFTRIHLRKNVRVLANETEFKEWQLSIGDGLMDVISIPEKIVVKNLQGLVSQIFSDFSMESCSLLCRCILAIRNTDVDIINDFCLSLFPGLQKVYHSVDMVNEDGDLTIEYLNSLTPPGLPPSKLILKTGVPVVLIRNLNVKEGLCNGTRLIITRMYNNSLTLLNPSTLKSFTIPRIPIITKIPGSVFEIKRLQFPIKLAFSMTVNKSQGQTFDKVGLDFRQQAFTHGQLYVAISRVRSMDGLAILAEGQELNNIVYKEIIQSTQNLG